MEYKEQEIPFTDADRAKMKAEANKAMLVISIMGGVSLLIAVAILIGTDVWFGFIFPAFVLGIGGYMYYNYSRDMARGAKLRISGEITDKYEKTTRSKNSTSIYYYLTIGKRELSVQHDMYNRFRVGEQVMFSITYQSKTILDAISLSQPNKPEQVADINPFSALLQRDENAKLSEHKTVKKIAPLTSEDAKVIRAARTQNIWNFLFILIFVVVFGGIIGGIILALLLVGILQIIPVLYRTYVTGFLFYGVPVVLILALVEWLRSRLKPFNRDLAEKQKQVILTTIDDKFKSNTVITQNGWRVTSSVRSSGGHYYYIKFAGRSYPISKIDYDGIDDVSQFVEIHLAPHSEVVLKVTIPTI